MSSGSREQQKKECRKVYKQLLEAGQEVDDQVQLNDIPEVIIKITDLLASCEDNASNFFRDINADNATDCLMDAAVFKMAHDLISTTTEKLAHSEFRDNEFLVGLFGILNSNQPDKLTQMAIECCKTSQLQLSMLGTFDIDAAPREQKMRKVRQTQKKDMGPKQAPENIKQIIKKDKGAEKINTMRTEIERVCRQRKTNLVPYFEVVVHPKSYMKTVDAAFQIAFLVRDGIIGLKRINNEPYVCLCEREPSQSHTRRDIAEETVQTVMSIDPQLWKEQIKKYKLKAPLLHLDVNEGNAESDGESDE